MKRKIAALIMSMMVLSTNVIAYADTQEIQLTDYRYQNAYRGLYGYNFFNGDFGTESPEEKTYYNSEILKPDGTEMFQQGEYTVYARYEQEEAEGYYKDIIFNYPQRGKKFLVSQRGKLNMCLLDEDGRQINSWPSYMQFVYFLNDDIAILSPSPMEFDVVSHSNYLMLADVLSLKSGVMANTSRFDDYKAPSEMGGGSATFVYTDDEQKYVYIRQNGVDFYFDALGNRVEKPEGVEFSAIAPYIEDYEIELDNPIDIPQLDCSYIFRTKEIGGKTYYALFKQLKDGESATDYTPKEQPSTWATDSISKATSEGLLYNNANCRYKANISRQDFCILAVEAYCKSQGMEIDDYIKANNITLDYKKFTDTDNAYVLLANELGIVSGTSDTTFSPDRGITRQEAAVLLNNIASLCELKPNFQKTSYTDEAKFATWAKDAIYNVSNIQNSDGIAIMNGMEENHFSPWSLYSREQAYVTIYRLYELCNQK
jgi:hypothetical protein